MTDTKIDKTSWSVVMKAGALSSLSKLSVLLNPSCGSNGNTSIIWKNRSIKRTIWIYFIDQKIGFAHSLKTPLYVEVFKNVLHYRIPCFTKSWKALKLSVLSKNDQKLFKPEEKTDEQCANCINMLAKCFNERKRTTTSLSLVIFLTTGENCLKCTKHWLHLSSFFTFVLGSIWWFKKFNY